MWERAGSPRPTRMTADVEVDRVPQTPPLLELARRIQALRQAARPAGAHRRTCWAPACARKSCTRSIASIWRSPNGEVVGLVGESGCGKSTLGRIAVGLLPLSEGERRWRGRRSVGARSSDGGAQQQLKMQMIFQDPYASLNPRMRVVDIVGEAPVVHGLIGPRQQIEYVGLQLNRVGLDPTLMRRFPHQFSGGQRARIGIARALAVKPEFLVCDESVAALDVSIQAQVLNLFMDLRAALEPHLSLHQPRSRRRAAHQRSRRRSCTSDASSNRAPTRRAVRSAESSVHAGAAAEVGKVEPKKRTFVPIRGEIPSPLEPPSGCHFHPRCPYAMPRCREVAPRLRRDRAGPVVGVSSQRRGAALMARRSTPRRSGRADPAGARFAAQRHRTIRTTSTTPRRARWCGGPRTRTSSELYRRGAARSARR